MYQNNNEILNFLKGPKRPRRIKEIELLKQSFGPIDPKLEKRIRYEVRKAVLEKRDSVIFEYCKQRGLEKEYFEFEQNCIEFRTDTQILLAYSNKVTNFVEGIMNTVNTAFNDAVEDFQYSTKGLAQITLDQLTQEFEE